MQFAQLSTPAPSLPPTVSRRQEGPFRELDMLAIGSVLLAVLLILAVRKVFGKNR